MSDGYDINTWGKHGALTSTESWDRHELEGRVRSLAGRLHNSSPCGFRVFSNEDLEEIEKTLKPLVERMDDPKAERKIQIRGCPK